MWDMRACTGGKQRDGGSFVGLWEARKGGTENDVRKFEVK